MIKRVLFGLALSGAVAAVGSQLVEESAVAVSPEQACAERLGIAWTVGDGATEQLVNFNRCLLGKPPIGIELQAVVGYDYEVLYSSSTGVYTIKPVTTVKVGGPSPTPGTVTYVG